MDCVLFLPKIACYKTVVTANNNAREAKSFSIKYRKNNAERKTRSEGETMASNKTLVPEAKAALDKFKMEAASEVGVNLTQGYNGDLTSRQAGSVGGQMVKKMIESYENSIKTK